MSDCLSHEYMMNIPAREISDLAQLAANPVVSVVMITYNHEKYVAQAIEGVIMQRCDFPIELLIGEDCSTDGTRAICESYQVRYPQIIRFITADHNVGAHKNSFRLFGRARGRYLAFCEGDDYWIDANKLEKQVAFMEQRPRVSMSFHAARIEFADGSRAPQLQRHKGRSILSSREVILGGGGLYPTCSAMFKRDVIDDYPGFFLKAPVGDATFSLNALRKGSVGYIDEIMAVYTSGVPGSWSERTAKEDLSRTLERTLGYAEMRKHFDQISGRQYTGALTEANSIDILYALKVAVKRLQWNNMCETLEKEMAFKHRCHLLVWKSLCWFRHMKHALGVGAGLNTRCSSSAADLTADPHNEKHTLDSEPPRFDVAITTYKRPELARAAVLSCLSQGPQLRKVIVADDDSADNTAEVIRALNDPRITFFQRKEQGGIAAARRDAFALSEAPWTVSLDSDHELLPGALTSLAQLLANNEDKAVDILGGRYRWDTGEITPRNVPQQVIGYQARIVLSGKIDNIGSDYVCAISRRLRNEVKWEPLRSGLPDTLFQLDIAKTGNAVFTSEVIGLEKSTAPHGWSRGNPEQRWKRRCQDAADSVRCLNLIVARHGEALQKWGMQGFVGMLVQGAFYSILAGQRVSAWGWLLKVVRLGKVSRHFAVVALLTILPLKVIRKMYLMRG